MRPALARVLLALADKEAVAKKDARALERLALTEGVLLGDKHFVDQRRMAEEDEALIE